MMCMLQGEMVEMGTYDELLASSSSFKRLLENIHQRKKEEEQEQPEYYTSSARKRSVRYVTFTGTENDTTLSIDPETFETKEEGAVKWNVYVEYLQAGVGRVCGVLLILFTFGFREVAFIFHGWWLAEWSDDEGHRHQHRNNCTSTITRKMTMIQSMDDNQWNDYRNNRFYFYCGE